METLEKSRQKFEECFCIITEEEAKKLWNRGNRNFLLLYCDGSDSYADNYGSWAEILRMCPLFFGIEKI